jgi:hypothetical protein
MPRIRTVPVEEATGSLRAQYDAGVKRAGRVAGILARDDRDRRLARKPLPLLNGGPRRGSPCRDDRRCDRGGGEGGPDEDVAAPRAHGFSDTGILEATEIVGLFNSINRIADALDVELDPGMPGKPR